jgi:branched-chain amino acid transport system substrate-binding protein
LPGVLILAECQGIAPNTIIIGLNLELTGNIPKVGEHSQVAAEMFVEEVNADGGVQSAGQTYTLALVIEDNNGTAEGATAIANKLITQDEVLILVGPNASVAAVPAGEVANKLETPLISPWSTNPNTTLNRPWVFRAPLLDPSKGRSSPTLPPRSSARSEPVSSSTSPATIQPVWRAISPALGATPRRHRR